MHAWPPFQGECENGKQTCPRSAGRKLAVLGQQQRKGRRKPQGTAGGRRSLHCSIHRTVLQPPTQRAGTWGGRNSALAGWAQCSADCLSGIQRTQELLSPSSPGSRYYCPRKVTGAGPGSGARWGAHGSGGHSVRHAHPGGQRPALSRPSRRRATQEQQPHERERRQSPVLLRGHSCPDGPAPAGGGEGWGGGARGIPGDPEGAGSRGNGREEGP